VEGIAPTNQKIANTFVMDSRETSTGYTNWRTKIEMYDKILVNDIKNSLEDWMTTHGEITMGSEMTEDVNRIIDETVERRMRIRQDWMLPDRC
jgi:hypothetical protein